MLTYRGSCWLCFYTFPASNFCSRHFIPSLFRHQVSLIHTHKHTYSVVDVFCFASPCTSHHLLHVFLPLSSRSPFYLSVHPFVLLACLPPCTGASPPSPGRSTHFLLCLAVTLSFKRCRKCHDLELNVISKYDCCVCHLIYDTLNAKLILKLNWTWGVVYLSG